MTDRKRHGEGAMTVVDPDAEACLLAIEGKPQIGSLWRNVRKTHLDRPLIARLVAYTPLGKPLMVHHFCTDAAPVWERKRATASLRPSTCGHEWVTHLNYLLSEAWVPFKGCEKCGWEDPGTPAADMDEDTYRAFICHTGQTDRGDFGCMDR